MSRLVEANILPELSLAGETQVELVWETLGIKKGDWATVGAALDTGTMPMRRHSEIRCYANTAMAQHAIENLFQNKKSA